jgi:hypothetical protein
MPVLSVEHLLVNSWKQGADATFKAVAASWLPQMNVEMLARRSDFSLQSL